jgi:NADPH:quinone reductase-like Zn-dependent oxidoreductase
MEIQGGIGRRTVLGAALTAAVAAGTATPAGAAAGDHRTSDSRSTRQAKGTTSRAWQLGEQMGVESLRLAARSLSDPGPGEALIEVRACGLNHRDLFVAAGTYGGAKPPERVPVGDGAGVVLAVGEGVTGVKPGDRVTAPHFSAWIDGDYRPDAFAADFGVTRDGWLAEGMLAPAAALVRIPDYLSFEEAAAFPAAGITAWTVIHNLGHAAPGDTVLALGTGGVSIFALQIAKMHGARMVITSSSDEKLAVAKALGADIGINYSREPEWDRAVLEATGGRGADIIVETVGLSTLARSINCCAPNARIGLLGSLAPAPEQPANLYRLVGKNAILKGITSGSRRMLEDLLRAAEINRLRPNLDRVFPFAQAREAYRYLDSGAHIGKIIISLQ